MKMKWCWWENEWIELKCLYLFQDIEQVKVSSSVKAKKDVANEEENNRKPVKENQ